ncbi:MAG: hypothetical protein KC776_03605 [Myxococcales bacterium]|nr:hypothetical protein [Myxococcales bacterium]MCB9581281.1 hypothetical protein [Polyangiaceae bacterium]
MAWKKTAAVGLCGWLLTACGSAPKERSTTPAPAYPAFASQEAPAGEYQVYTVALSTQPATRFRCTLYTAPFNAGDPQEPHVLEWDPQASAPLTRSIRSAGVATCLECGSEILALGEERRAHLLQYAPPKQPPAAADAGPLLCGGFMLPSKTNEWPFELRDSLSDGGGALSSVTVKLGANPVSMTGAELLRRAATPVARTRSLEPLTPLAEDALRVVANVAVERAKKTGSLLLRRAMEDFFCSDKLGGSKGPFRGIVPPHDVAFPSTCAVLKTVRIEDIAASGRLLQRALAKDLIHLGVTQIVRVAVPSQGEAQFRQPLESIERLVGDLLDGRSITTERDVQVAVLDIMRWASAGKKSTQLLDKGLAALATCLEDGPCTADQLLKQLQGVKYAEAWPELPQVLSHIMDVLRPPPGISARATAKAAINVELDVLLHALQERVSGEIERNVELLRATAGPALEQCLKSEHCDFDELAGKFGKVSAQLRWLGPVVLAIEDQGDSPTVDSVLAAAAERVQQHPELLNGRLASWSETIEHLRALVNAVLDDDVGRAVQSASAFVGDAIDTACDEDAIKPKLCKLPVSTATARKAFSIAGAFVAYSASYRPSTDGSTLSQEELDTRAEERKKAMESLIDAATERQDRKGDVVVSAGAAVGAAYTPGTWATEGDRRGQLTLPVGFSVESLPGAPSVCGIGNARVFGPFGCHFGLTLLDVAQYASTDGDSTAEPEIGTAVFLGGRAGLLIGLPNASLLVGVDGGYAPGIKYGDGTRGVARFGVFAGTYVPFIDFN